MMVGAAAAIVGTWGVRALAHHAILRGLRAPRLPHLEQPADLGLPAARVPALRIAGPRGRGLFGWLVPPPEGTPMPAPAVLVMHGWGTNAGMMLPVVPALHTAGLAVLLIDARCHGRSDDEPFTSMPRFAEDIAAGLAWLQAQPGIAADRVALLGHSVGAAAAMLHAAQHRNVQAVISLSAFAHPREVMRRLLAEKRLPCPVLGWYILRHVQRVIGAAFDDIAPLSTLPRVQCPVLLVHGRDDTTVPPGDAHRLQQVSGGARLLLVDGGHDLRETLPPHADALVQFLREAAVAQPAQAEGGH